MAPPSASQGHDGVASSASAVDSAKGEAADFVQHSEGMTPALTGRVQFNSTYFGQPKGVLANDSDVDGDPLSAVLVSGPQHGTINLNGDGTFAYRPGLRHARATAAAAWQNCGPGLRC